MSFRLETYTRYAVLMSYERSECRKRGRRRGKRRERGEKKVREEGDDKEGEREERRDRRGDSFTVLYLTKYEILRRQMIYRSMEDRQSNFISIRSIEEEVDGCEVQRRIEKK